MTNILDKEPKIRNVSSNASFLLISLSWIFICIPSVAFIPLSGYKLKWRTVNDISLMLNPRTYYYKGYLVVDRDDKIHFVVQRNALMKICCSKWINWQTHKNFYTRIGQGIQKISIVLFINAVVKYIDNVDGSVILW